DPWQERLRIESPDAWTFSSIPEEALSELSPALRELLDALQPGPLPAWPALQEFLEGARRRAAEPHLGSAGLVFDGEQLILRTTDGLRAVFAPGPPASPPTVEFPGYEQRGSFWVAPGTSWKGPAPLPDSSPPHTLVLAWSRTTRLPREDHPIIPTVGPDPPRLLKLPAHLTRETIVTREEAGRAVAVTSGGWVLYFPAGENQPAWLTQIPTPLPGPHGFPVLPRKSLSLDSPRGPEHAGPVSDGRTPRIFLFPDEFLVVTDKVYRFRESGALEEHAIAFLPDEVRAVRDVTIDAYGEIWVLPVAGDHLLSRTHRVPLDLEGGFQVQSLGSRVVVIGHHRDRFQLQELFAQAKGLKPGALLPLPELAAEEDRAGLRITALGEWGEALLLVHDSLYLGEAGAGGWSWRPLVAWPGKDPFRIPFYLQTAPRRVGDTLMVSRPWGVVEGWKVVE
ncbi:MAG: hypothetical protein V3T77_03645, partial [Planctomycetota bacterium]